MGGLMTLLVVIGLGFATYGWFLRFFGVACFAVGSTFLYVWAVTGREDLGGYFAFALLIIFGIGFWLGGHMIHLHYRGYFASPLGKQGCVAMGYTWDGLVALTRRLRKAWRTRQTWRAAGI